MKRKKNFLSNTPPASHPLQVNLLSRFPVTVTDVSPSVKHQTASHQLQMFSQFFSVSPKPTCFSSYCLSFPANHSQMFIGFFHKLNKWVGGWGWSEGEGGGGVLLEVFSQSLKPAWGLLLSQENDSAAASWNPLTRVCGLGVSEERGSTKDGPGACQSWWIHFLKLEQD